MTTAQENSIVVLATQRMVDLGTESAQRCVLGKESKNHDNIADRIFTMLKAYRKRDDLSEKQVEAILWRIKTLTDGTVD